MTKKQKTVVILTNYLELRKVLDTFKAPKLKDYKTRKNRILRDLEYLLKEGCDIDLTLPPHEDIREVSK